MNILVTGSRHWDDRDSVWRILDGQTAGARHVHLVHGDCHIDGEPAGADRWAQEWAEHRRKVLGLPTTWRKYTATGRYGPWPARGPKRNEHMVMDFRRLKSPGDKCLVFYVDPRTDKGTKGCRDLIKKHGMKANTFYYNREVRRGDSADASNGNRGEGAANRLGGRDSVGRERLQDRAA